MKIFNFGSLNMDKVYRVKEFVRSGQTVSALDLYTYPGGKGLNQSVAVARAGGQVYHVGCVGEDGEFLKQFLLSNHVHCDFVKDVEGFSGHAVIQVDQKGQNCIIVYPGANHKLEREYIDQVFEVIQKDDIILLQNEINLVDYVMAKGRERGARIVLNPSPVTDELQSFPLELVRTFILNEIEAMYISGEAEIEDMLKALEVKYPESEIVLTLGEKGSVYRFKGNEQRFGIFKTDSTDTTGAGDTYCGYFLACSALGMTPFDACVYASAAAAIAVSKKGAASSIPNMDNVKTFLKIKEK